MTSRTAEFSGLFEDDCRQMGTKGDDVWGLNLLSHYFPMGLEHVSSFHCLHGDITLSFLILFDKDTRNNVVSRELLENSRVVVLLERGLTSDLGISIADKRCPNTVPHLFCLIWDLPFSLPGYQALLIFLSILSGTVWLDLFSLPKEYFDKTSSSMPTPLKGPPQCRSSAQPMFISGSSCVTDPCMGSSPSFISSQSSSYCAVSAALSVLC
ncbi:uncharacterized protein [Macaca nemestrina]|uniref:uncharacterized protein n=1 Tax=Macaca nemestrina TaxID=9545 RepID=UPI0039B88AFD